VALGLVLVACGSGGEGTAGDDALARPRPSTTSATPTTAAASAPCGLRPLTFQSERWQAGGQGGPGGAGVLWEQTYTFSNPNTVEVRLQPHTVHLRLTGSLGYFLKMARSSFRPAPDEMVPAGKDQQRVAQVWLEPGNTPATEDVFVTTSARVAGADCAVPVERLSTTAPPGHVLALPTCDPQQATTPC
jgi:hypothetical protein